MGPELVGISREIVWDFFEEQAPQFAAPARIRSQNITDVQDVGSALGFVGRNDLGDNDPDAQSHPLTVGAFIADAQQLTKLLQVSVDHLDQEFRLINAVVLDDDGRVFDGQRERRVLLSHHFEKMQALAKKLCEFCELRRDQVLPNRVKVHVFSIKLLFAHKETKELCHGFRQETEISSYI